MRLVFGLLLCLFPGDFREQFGDAMRADLEDDWNRRTGLLDRLRFVQRLLPDVGSAAAA